MRSSTLIAGALLPACFALYGCVNEHNAATESHVAVPNETLAAQQWKAGETPAGVDSWALLPKSDNQPDRVAAGSTGLWLLDAAGKPLAPAYSGRYSTLDARKVGSAIVSATLDQERDQTLLVSWSAQQGFAAQQRLPAARYPIESLCFYQDQNAHLYLFLIGEEGLGQQWLVAEQAQLLDKPQLMRQLHLPVGAKHCAVNDVLQTLFVSEEYVGIWAYPANPETNGERQIVDLVAPYGQLQDSPQGLASTVDGVVALDDAANLHRYRHDAAGWQADAPLSLTDVRDVERLFSRRSEQPYSPLELLLGNPEEARLYTASLPAAEPLAAAPQIISLPAQAQTAPVPHGGDAADDPAIWINPRQPEQSRILGTDKRGGLGVYSLRGEQLQYLPVGRINNVDLRSGFQLAGKTIDLAVASNRDSNSLELFAIDQLDGRVTGLGRIGVPLDDIYGLCMAKGVQGDIYAIANDKSGRFLQYLLEDDNGQVTGVLVREFATQTQPEGCVADDARQRLFIGEEGVGVWALSAAAEAPTELVEVIRAQGPLHADVEGMAIYQAEQPYLVVSSQGNDSYLVLDAEPPYQLRGAFRVGLNIPAGIDGVSETDGLEVTSANLGGVWGKGMLVVQDGRKRMPQGNQNFKMVAWEHIAKSLNLP